MKCLVGATTILVLLGVAYGGETSRADRPAYWAKPMQMKGVPNFHKVSDTLYRSAQPSEEGMRNLKAMGIETIVNLRSFHSDRDEIRNTGLAYEHIYMKAWHPEEEEAVRFLQIVTNSKRAPVLVHCQHWRGSYRNDVRPLPHRGARLEQGGRDKGNDARGIWVSRYLGQSHPLDQRSGCGRNQEEIRNPIKHRTGRRSPRKGKRKGYPKSPGIAAQVGERLLVSYDAE